MFIKSYKFKYFIQISKYMIKKLTSIIRPHVIVKDITCLNFKKMKEMGMEKIIFDKDNTLCHDHHPKFPNE